MFGNKQNAIIAVVVSCALLTSGCAAMFNGTKDTVSINSDVDDAKLYVNGRYVGEENAVTDIKKKGTVIIKAKKEGCDARSVPVTREFDPVSLLGLLIDFGVISMLVIDTAATGAISKAQNTNYQVNPDCD